MILKKTRSTRRLTIWLLLFPAIAAILGSVSCAPENHSAARLTNCVREHGIPDKNSSALIAETESGTLKFRTQAGVSLKISLSDETRYLEVEVPPKGISRDTDWYYSNRTADKIPQIESVCFRCTKMETETLKVAIRASGQDTVLLSGDEYERIVSDAQAFADLFFETAQTYLSEKFGMNFSELFR